MFSTALDPLLDQVKYYIAIYQFIQTTLMINTKIQKALTFHVSFFTTRTQIQKVNLYSKKRF